MWHQLRDVMALILEMLHFAVLFDFLLDVTEEVGC